MKHELTHLDLFSGIGGFAIAAQRTGFRTIAFSEVDPYACAVLSERFPKIPNLGDVRKRESFAGIGPITVLTGGFPCQPFSKAGLRRGKDDPRHLWPAMLDLIQAHRPTWVVGENVYGLINMGLDQVCSDLEASGYSVQPLGIPACAVDAHHRRERLWILAHSDSERHLYRQTSQQPAEAGIDAQRHASPSVQDVSSRWTPEPELDRMAHGLPDWPHRTKALGNAIVPQVAEQILRHIAAIERLRLT